VPDKITRLTDEQQAMLPQIRDAWLAIGLSTQPADWPAAELGIHAAYKAGGLPGPRIIIRVASPWAGAVAQAVAPDIIRRHHAQVDAQVGDQVDAQVRAQVDDQVDDHVHAQVRDHLGAQVDDQVRAQVRAQVRDHVHDHVHAQVHAQVRDQVDDHVHDHVHDQVDDQVRDQVRAQVHDQVRDQVRDQVDDQVRAQVDDQVDAQVDDQVRAQVRAQVRDHVHDHVHAQVRDQVDDQVGDQVRAQVHAQVRDQVRERLPYWYQARISGQHWAGYYSYYYTMTQLGVKDADGMAGQMLTALSAGWWWAYRHFAIITDRPEVLERDPLGRLHSATGMAVRYRDGWGFYAWHGRRVPAWVIEDPTPERIAAERNVEVRRCAIEAMGWDRFVEEAHLTPVGTRVPDPGNPGQYLVLYDVPERLWGSRIRLLMCVNGSVERDGTRRRYGITVPASVSDPVEAAAWTARLTKDVYARMVRRT
jgi:hypothetical protein